MYTISKNGDTIIRTVDRACIPINDDNIDYQAFLKWKLAGGVSKDEIEDPAMILKAKINALRTDMIPLLIESISILLSEDKAKIKGIKDKINAKIADGGLTIDDLISD